MKPRVIIAIVAAAVVAGGIVYAVGQFGGGGNAAAGKNNDKGGPGPSERAQPNALVVGSDTYDFGTMEVGETLSHTFKIRNEGDTPIELTNGGSSCSCTVNTLEDVVLQPGDEAPVELTWTPKVQDREFQKSATVKTHDPELDSHGSVELRIVGIVDELLTLEPTSSWDVGIVPGGSPVEVKGKVYSRVVETFEVEFGGDDDVIVKDVELLDEDALAALGAKFGYTYVATVPAATQSEFTRGFDVKTTIGDGTSHQMKIIGHAQGALSIQPIGRIVYHPRANALNMGRFPASEGRTVRLAMMIRDVPDEGLNFTEITTDPDVLEVKAVRDRTFRVPGKQRYELSFTYPAGSPPDVRTNKNSAKVVVPTGHPEVGDVEFFVQFIAD